MKKRIFSIFMIMVFAFAMISCGNKDDGNNNQEQTPSAGIYTPGTYEGKATGYGGDIIAKVELSANRIESITCIGENETNGIGSVAIEKLPTAMVEQQTVYVDAIAGATYSSKGVVDAVTAALTAAGVDVQSLQPTGTVPTAEPIPTEETMSADIVVIGAGGAGMTAALEATNAGRNVLIIEKQAMVGGNTIKATGGMNAAGTQLQKDEGVDDSVEVFIDDTMSGGNYVNNEELVRTLAERSADGVAWLESIGAPLKSLTFSGGASFKRMHAPEGGAAVGPYIVQALSQQLADKNVNILYNTAATEIVTTNGEVTGVIATGNNIKYTINCEAVILATGGFGANEEMVTKYNPDLAGFKTTNSPGIVGDGIRMAEAVGANVIDMEQIQVHPTVEQETSTLITESVRGQGAILVNKNGERFFNEMSTRDLVSKAIMQQEGGSAYLIFDQQVRDNLSAIETYVSADLVEEEDNLADLAEDIGVDPETLIKTVADWNDTVTNKSKDVFERTTGMDRAITVAPYYAIKVAPAIHHTMGGVQIDTQAQVLSKTGTAIPGLFAAGEVTGGVHGANRIGGNAVAEVVVFGRIAGQSASAYVQNH
ncbi:MAG: flavocytochrome c [Clostridiales bacterium]|nr:flavocytochrome c [Clostridiales bacterium]